MRGLVFILVSLLLAGCAGLPLGCAGDQQVMQTAELLFGRNIGDRVGVSESDWRAFVDREITPRFPDGLTVTDGKGQWRDSERHTIVREPSKIVTIVLPSGAADNEARIEAIVQAYKTRFHQQGVGVIVRSACVTFSSTP